MGISGEVRGQLAARFEVLLPHLNERQQGITPEQARRTARREVAQHGYEIRSVAEQLNRRGHL